MRKRTEEGRISLRGMGESNWTRVGGRCEEIFTGEIRTSFSGGCHKNEIK